MRPKIFQTVEKTVRSFSRLSRARVCTQGKVDNKATKMAEGDL
jgi:hypothetical protein